MSYFREAINFMEEYIPGEQPEKEGYIKLNTNENPYPPSPLVEKKIKEALGLGKISLYPHPLGGELRERAQEVYGLPLDWIAVGNGSDELLNLLFRLFLDKGDRVAYPFPTYTLYRTLAFLQEAEREEIPFPPDFSLPESFLTSPAKLKVVCNPNSPTGTFLPLSQIEKLLSLSSCPVIVDEAYVDFAPCSALPLLQKFPNLIIVRTFSKSFSLAGLRVGLLFAHPDIVRGVLKIKDSYNVGILSQAGGAAALEDMEHMRKNVEKIKSTREWFSAEMEKLGFLVYPSQANFIMARKEGRDLKFLYEELKKRKILVRYFPQWPDSLRITIGKEEEMKTLLAAVQEIIGRVNV